MTGTMVCLFATVTALFVGRSAAVAGRRPQNIILFGWNGALRHHVDECLSRGEPLRGKLRDNPLNRKRFPHVFELRYVVDCRPMNYNRYGSYSSKGYVGPTAFAAIGPGSDGAGLRRRRAKPSRYSTLRRRVPRTRGGHVCATMSTGTYAGVTWLRG